MSTLIDRYVQEVGRYLPEKNRSDIRDELRSILNDMLDDRARQAGRAADEEMMVELLREYGEPAKVAASYGRPRYLIGPGIYPQYIKVLNIVFFALTIAFVVLFGIGLMTSAWDMQGFTDSLVDTIANLASAFLTGFAFVTLVFLIIERASEGKVAEAEKWNPRDLPQVEDEMTAQPVSLIVGIVFSLIFLYLFNFSFDKVLIYWITDGGMQSMRFLSDAFRSYIPYISILLGADILLSLWVVIRGRWSSLTKWLEVATNLATAGLAGRMLLPPALVLSESELGQQVSGDFLSGFTITDLHSGIALAVRIALGIIILVALIDAGVSAYNLVRRK